MATGKKQQKNGYFRSYLLDNTKFVRHPTGENGIHCTCDLHHIKCLNNYILQISGLVCCVLLQVNQVSKVWNQGRRNKHRYRFVLSGWRYI